MHEIARSRVSLWVQKEEIISPRELQCFWSSLLGSPAGWGAQEEIVMIKNEFFASWTVSGAHLSLLGEGICLPALLGEEKANINRRRSQSSSNFDKKKEEAEKVPKEHPASFEYPHYCEWMGSVHRIGICWGRRDQGPNQVRVKSNQVRIKSDQVRIKSLTGHPHPVPQSVPLLCGWQRIFSLNKNNFKNPLVSHGFR